MRRPTLMLVVVVLVAILALFGAYMGSYYALLKEAIQVQQFGPTPDAGPSGPVTMRAIYHYLGEAPGEGHWFFMPANKLDRLIRPAYWQPAPHAPDAPPPPPDSDVLPPPDEPPAE